jgi:hypothetical protein
LGGGVYLEMSIFFECDGLPAIVSSLLWLKK